MRLHILGICGTFMGGVAALARELGDRVEGSDANVYPPMSTQLQEMGIAIANGYGPQNLEPRPDLVIIGNAVKTGNPEVQAVLDSGMRYLSFPEALAEFFIQDRESLVVTGTAVVSVRRPSQIARAGFTARLLSILLMALIWLFCAVEVINAPDVTVAMLSSVAG